MLEKFCKRFADSQHGSEVVGGEIRAGTVRISSATADLNDADDARVGENGSADNFLDGFSDCASDFHTFKNAGVANSGKRVVNFGATLARGTRGE